MRVAIVRNAVSGCEPQCDEWISAEGKIDKTTLGVFRRVLKSLGVRKLPIFISSGGGDVDAAIEIGRLVRSKGLDVAVTKTAFAPDAAPPPKENRSGQNERSGAAPSHIRGWAQSREAFCASACTLILAAGQRRFVAHAAHVGVHEIIIPAQTVTQRVRYYQIQTLRRGDRIISRQKVFVDEKKIARHISRSKPSADVYRKVREFLIQMGETRDVVELMKTAPPEGIRWLTRVELASTRLSTEDRGGETLIRAAPPLPAPTQTAMRTTGASTYENFRTLTNFPAQAPGAAKPFGERAAPGSTGFAAMATRAFTPLEMWTLIGVGTGSLLAVGSLVARLRRPRPTMRLTPKFGPKPE